MVPHLNVTIHFIFTHDEKKNVESLLFFTSTIHLRQLGQLGGAVTLYLPREPLGEESVKI